MTPEQFITKWQANTRNEAAASKEHFLNLCELLGARGRVGGRGRAGGVVGAGAARMSTSARAFLMVACATVVGRDTAERRS